jgi:hypothetical protein
MLRQKEMHNTCINLVKKAAQHHQEHWQQQQQQQGQLP